MLVALLLALVVLSSIGPLAYFLSAALPHNSACPVKTPSNMAPLVTANSFSTLRREANDPYLTKEESRAQLQRAYNGHLRQVQAISRDLQRSIKVYNDRKWRIPRLISSATRTLEIQNRHKLERLLSSYHTERGSIQCSPMPSTACHQQRSIRSCRQTSKVNVVDAHQKPTVSYPLKGPLTDFLMQATKLDLKSLPTLTLSDTKIAMDTPMLQREVKLRHFEVGINGVVAIVSGRAFFDKREEQSERPIKPLRPDPEPQPHPEITNCNARWVFWGVLTAPCEGGSSQSMVSNWLCFGAPAAAITNDSLAGKDRITLQSCDLGMYDQTLQTRHADWCCPERGSFLTAPFPLQTEYIFDGGIAPIDFQRTHECFKKDFVYQIEDAMARCSLHLRSTDSVYHAEKKRAYSPRLAGLKRKRNDSDIFFKNTRR